MPVKKLFSKGWGRQAKRARKRGVKINERAYRVASKLVGVMEEGGNNRGAVVSAIIKANAGTGPEPWCGDFVAYCYRTAGSNQVSRSWAAVRLLTKGRRTHKPRRGDIVRFKFDHVGLFDRWVDPNTFTTIEGNTGAFGAVSDSATGGDGVYRKRRELSQVLDFRTLRAR